MFCVVCADKPSRLSGYPEASVVAKAVGWCGWTEPACSTVLLVLGWEAIFSLEIGVCGKGERKRGERETLLCEKPKWCHDDEV